MNDEERKARDREYKSQLYWSNPEKYRAKKRVSQKRYYEAHRETENERSRQWRKANAEVERIRKWKMQGLPEPTRPEPEFCECCGRLPTGRNKHLCLDHDHATGLFRAWLCGKCNRALGFAQDNPVILRKLAVIVENSISRTVAG